MALVTYTDPVILDSTGQDIVTQLTRLANTQEYTAGDGININSNVISTKVASASQLGAVKVGDGLSIDGSTNELSVVVDSALSTTSENPVQNKVITNAINAISSMSFEVVQELPTTDIRTDVIYLVPKSTAQTSNTYDEYICLDTTTTPATWEKIGDTQIDLSNYVQKSSTAGLIKNDGTIDTTTYVSDISGKADKVASATNGDFAGLDSNGNLTDSGKKASDFASSAIMDGTSIDSFGDVETALATKQDTISDLSTIRSGASAGATALQPSNTYGLVKNDGTIATLANAPIQGSSNPITSGGLYNEEKSIFNVMGITGALNYLRIEAVTTEVHGVTFTVNANKTISGNGLATEDIDFPIASQTQLQNIISTKGLLKLVGCPASGSLNSYYLYFVDDRTNETIDHGEGATIAYEGITTTPLYIHVKSGTQLNNVLFSPMVVDRNVISDYVKGVATNEDLEAALDGILDGTTLDSFGDVETALALKANTSALADYYTRAEQAVTGAYNLFDIDLPRINGASVTSPVASSETGSSLTVSNSTAGTYKEADYVGLSFPKNADLKAIFGATVTSGKGRFYIDGSNDGTNWTNIASSDLITETGSFTVPFNTGNYTSHRIRWYCTFDVSETGSVTYTDIMIVYASNTPSAYVPFAKTNKQLTDDVATIPTVSVSHTGTASSTGVRKEVITINNVSYDVDGSAYMEQSVTLSTSAATTVTFTNAIIADGAMLTMASSIWDLVPDSMTTAVGSCTITLPKWTSAETIGVRLYVR